ncbi:uncharacterized protein LOC126893764 [Daktulosphaira vitifoliae]|uniref:uncharacterized protein LOC126893764 n=1 Tax=Daktulosphaira vitifoliae TaxID=58002 RepID=UPI0021AAD615|nr:uncharacterized protein LOC126893764 [Daktulosphaira vitifoliae]
MSVNLSDSVVYCRSYNRQISTAVTPKRVSFYEDVKPIDVPLVQVTMANHGERGNPEGQEDPHSRELLSKKNPVLKLKEKRRSLYMNKSIDDNAQQVISSLIKSEVEKKEWYYRWNKHINLESSKITDIIKRDLFLLANESIYKVYKMLSICGSPLLIIITNIRFCVLTKNIHTKRLEFSYSSHFKNLDVIIMGPNEQTAIFISEKSKKFTLITAIDTQTATEMIGSMEYSFRKSGFYEPNKAFVVIHVYHNEKLYETIKNCVSLAKEDIFKYYTWLWCIKETESIVSTPPYIEEFLMVKKNSLWNPMFVCLRNDILYIFNDSSNDLPIETIPLRFGRCKNIRQINCDRPYSIEITLVNCSIIFATADCHQEEKWLNALNYIFFEKKKLKTFTTLPKGHCCLLTTNHMILYDFPHSITDHKQLINLDSIQYSPSPTHYYIILEWACYDATKEESCSNWTVHFTCKTSCDEFILWLNKLRPDLTSQELVDHQIAKRHSKLNVMLRCSFA